MPAYHINLAAKKINDAIKNQSSQTVTIQTYAHSVLKQPDVNFSGFDHLIQYQSDINDGLAIAKKHANEYLNTIKPNILKNIHQIDSYYTMHNAVVNTVPPGSNTKEWIKQLSLLRDFSAEYEHEAAQVVTQLQGLYSNLTADEGAFAAIVTNLNTVVKGDNGVLNSINNELDSLQSKIDLSIAGCVGSGLAIAGGIFLIIIGSVADFVTAGTSTPVVIGGIGILAAGTGGEVASAIILKELNNQKATLLLKQSTLNAEVNLALGIHNAYGSLKEQLSASVTAASSMQNAWIFLQFNLDSLVKDLTKGIASPDDIRKVLLTTANGEIKAVMNDIKIIKQQMTDAKVIIAPEGTTVGDATYQAAQEAA